MVTVEQAENYRLRVIHFTHNWKNFLTLKATELANKMILDPIIDKMKEMGVSRKIYENTVVDNVVVEEGFIYIRIHSEYFAENGFDVAVAREEGTEDHFIAPKGRGDQFSMDPEFRRRYSGANALSWIENGKRRFSMGHKVSGLPRLNIIEETVEKGEYELQQELNRQFAEWRRSVLG